MHTLFNIYYLKTFNDQQHGRDFKIAYVRKFLENHSASIFRIIHGRFYIVGLPSGILAQFCAERLSLCRGEPNRGMMLYSVANLHEIGFIARVHARISRWILVFVALYVWRVDFLFRARAISARTEILNRGTRKCQSRRRHVRLQRVPRWSR